MESSEYSACTTEQLRPCLDFLPMLRFACVASTRLGLGAGLATVLPGHEQQYDLEASKLLIDAAAVSQTQGL